MTLTVGTRVAYDGKTGTVNGPVGTLETFVSVSWDGPHGGYVGTIDERLLTVAPVDVTARLEALRAALEAENISYAELIELQGLAPFIEPGDVQLLEAAGVPEHPDTPPAPQAGDTLELVTGQRLLVQYTDWTPDGLKVYGRWIGQDGATDTLAAHILQDGDTIE